MNDGYIQNDNNIIAKQNDIINLFVKVYTKTIREIVKDYGKDSFQKIKNTFFETMLETCREETRGIEKRELHDFVNWLISSLTAGHKYEIVENTKESVRFKFTECPWAQFFRSLGAEDIGKLFCDVDESMAKLFNKKLKFNRTKTLMEGAESCDHHYFI